MKKAILILSMLIVAMLVVSACSPQSEPEQKQDQQVPQEPTAPAANEPDQEEATTPELPMQKPADEGQEAEQANTGSDTAAPKINVKEFTMEAKQFAFVPETILVKKGDTVKLTVTSTDVDHGLSISAFGVNENLPKGKTVEIEFVADRTGTFPMICHVFCGSGHGGMRGKLIVEE